MRHSFFLLLKDHCILLCSCNVARAPVPPASTFLVASPPPDYPVLETDTLAYRCTADTKKTFLPGLPGNQVK